MRLIIGMIGGGDIRLALKIPDNIQVAFKKNERILRGGYTFAHFSLLCVEFQRFKLSAPPPYKSYFYRLTSRGRCTLCYLLAFNTLYP